MRNKTFTFSLPDELAQRLEKYAKSKLLAKAVIVKMALQEYLEKNEKSENK